MAVTRSPPTCPFVTPRTADHIYGKLRVDSRVALTLYAQDGGLVWSRESGPAFSEAILECWSKNRRAIFLVGPR